MKKLDLKRAYGFINGRFYGGKLPQVYVCYGVPSPGTMATCWNYPSHTAIVIDRRLKPWPSVVWMTLFHEVVHVFMYKRYGERGKAIEHGKPFQKEMLRLARKGAFKEHW